MIGNTIEFTYYPKSAYGTDWNKKEKKEGVVVDAYTLVSGKIKGDSAFGFGETKGSTSSERMYKVQYFEDWDRDQKHPYLHDINDWMVTRIVKLAFPVILNDKFIKS